MNAAMTGWYKTARTEFSNMTGAILTKNGIGITKAGPKTVRDSCDHRVAVTWVNAVVKGGIHFISLYLIDTVGLNEANKLILEEVTVAIKSIKGPWILGGDWNLVPNVIAESGLLQMVGGTLLAPTIDTCNDNVYD